MTPRPIKTGAEYRKQKEALERLMTSKPTKQINDEIEMLSLLIEDYERTTFVLEMADPIDAIRFRMDQLGLTTRDLEPFIGTRSRVSEVMSGKRPLSLDMVRALNTHLEIPADVLIRKREAEPTLRTDLSESLKRLLIRRKILAVGESLTDLVERAGSKNAIPPPLFRKTLTERANARTNTTALLAWTAAVLVEANAKRVPSRFRSSALTSHKLAEIARISRSDNWAEDLAKELSKLGIVLVVMPHFPETYLDGAALKRADGIPVIALTLRHDRIDNFWFVLLHELSHIALHFDNANVAFFDDMDLAGNDKQESEADLSAQDALLPRQLWNTLIDRAYVTQQDIQDVAERVGVHEAIVAGRLRRETNDYRRFSGLVGSGAVRLQFPEYATRNV